MKTFFFSAVGLLADVWIVAYLLSMLHQSDWMRGPLQITGFVVGVVFVGGIAVSVTGLIGGEK